MDEKQYFKSKVFSLSDESDFKQLALELFQYQFRSNPVYRQFALALRVEADAVRELSQIPFLPIRFFKSRRVISGHAATAIEFTSSGTTGQVKSRHHVADLALYEQSFLQGWSHFYRPIEEYCVLALLPSYLERKASSLVYMAQQFIDRSRDGDSGFYLDQWEKLEEVLRRKIKEAKPTLLLGVTFGLLELAERCKLPENDLIVMETGGMKGRRREMIRSEVHQILQKQLGVSAVHSEYGMTELLTQAYAQADGYFATPPWMQVSVRQTDDPLSEARPGKTGGLNVIDLANIDSCAFIATDDLARLHPDKRFEVMGRFDNSDIRGCNLMVI